MSGDNEVRKRIENIIAIRSENPEGKRDNDVGVREMGIIGDELAKFFESAHIIPSTQLDTLDASQSSGERSILDRTF